MNNGIFISIVIPTCNRHNLLIKCLDCLNAQTLDKSIFEIVVSDDGDAAETNNIVSIKYPQIRIVQGPKKGPAANRNNGVRYATGEWIVFVDDDCLPDQELLSEYIKAINLHPGIKVFEGRIYVDRPQKLLNEEAPINESGGHLWSCNFAIQKNLFLNVGGFNEAFPFASMEDLDMHDRLKSNGIIIPFLFNASVVHPWRLVEKPKVRFERTYLSHLIYFKVNPSGIEKFRIPYYLKHIGVSLVKSTLPNILKFRGRGISYSFYFHLFQIRVLFYLTKRSVIHEKDIVSA